MSMLLQNVKAENSLVAMLEELEETFLQVEKQAEKIFKKKLFHPVQKRVNKYKTV